MARNIIAFILGLVVAFLITAAIQSVNYSLFPIPPDLDQTDPELMKKFAASLPFGAYFVVYLSHVISALVSVFVASKVASSQHRILSYGIGGFLMLMGIFSILRLSYPSWFVICDLLSYLPCAILGRRMAGF